MISDEDLRLAIDRIARTSDGHSVYLYLQKIALAPAPAGALERHEGSRLLALHLMELMSDGLIATGSGIHHPVVLGQRRAAPERPRGYREWASKHDPESNSGG